MTLKWYIKNLKCSNLQYDKKKRTVIADFSVRDKNDNLRANPIKLHRLH